MKTASKLTQFRKQCEREAGKPANRIRIPLADALSDVCRALGITGQQRRRVLGRKSTVLLEDTRQERYQLVERQ